MKGHIIALTKKCCLTAGFRHQLVGWITWTCDTSKIWRADLPPKHVCRLADQLLLQGYFIVLKQVRDRSCSSRIHTKAFLLEMSGVQQRFYEKSIHVFLAVSNIWVMVWHWRSSEMPKIIAGSWVFFVWDRTSLGHLVLRFHHINIASTSINSTHHFTYGLC